MIRRSFFQILSGLLLPVPASKAVASTRPVQAGTAAPLASSTRSAFPPAPAIDPAFPPAPAESPHFRKAITPHPPPSVPGHTAPDSADGADPSTGSPFAPNPDPEWLREWHRIPRVEIREDDLPHLHDPCQRNLAALILPRIRSGRSFAFRYLAGSSPGGIRRVLPTSLSRLDPISHCQFPVDGAGGIAMLTDTPIYLLAWCQTRNAPRTFRLDRMLPA